MNDAHRMEIELFIKIYTDDAEECNAQLSAPEEDLSQFTKGYLMGRLDAKKSVAEALKLLIS